MASDGITIDTSQFDRAMAEFQAVHRTVFHRADQAAQQSSRKIRDAWRDKLEGNEYAPRVPYSISYERIRGGTDEFEYEIGANKGTGQQGGVALLLEYGARRKNLAVRGYGAGALAENIDDLQQGIERAMIDGVRDVGW